MASIRHSQGLFLWREAVFWHSLPFLLMRLGLEVLPLAAVSFCG